MNYDLLASGILLGGSSVALALTALAARRAKRDRRRATFAADNARADAARASKSATAAKTHAERSMRAANAASLDRLFTPPPSHPHGITVTRPETVDVIPIPVPPLKLYQEVEGVPGSVVEYGADPGDIMLGETVNVLGFPDYWRDHGGEAGA
jgi:hypothetical protein